jgi:hypothetical protein
MNLRRKMRAIVAVAAAYAVALQATFLAIGGLAYILAVAYFRWRS